MSKILKDNLFIDYQGDLKNNKGVISFEKGENINFSSKTKYIVPGFIDQHIHGGFGVDTMDNSVEALETFSKGLIAEGTTSFLPTTMTYEVDTLKSIHKKIYYLMKKDSPGSQIIGVHLEGPFINVDYKGAQNKKYVIEPNINIMSDLNQYKNIKVVTYAPEKDSDNEYIKYLANLEIKGQIGHSGATFSECDEAINEGATGFTHLHNASSVHHHREPGVVSSGLASKSAHVELIADGIHLHPDTLKTVYQIKGSDKIILITDAMRAKGMPDGEYDLGGQLVIKKGGEARLKTGELAGSVLQMNKAVRNMYKFSGCKLEEAFQMASKNVAQYLNLKNIGEIKEGYIFDVITLDEDFNVLDVFIKGEKKQYRGE